jgi:hypothetical protein
MRLASNAELASADQPPRAPYLVIHYLLAQGANACAD